MMSLVEVDLFDLQMRFTERIASSVRDYGVVNVR